jgi:hypothetical protein
MMRPHSDIVNALAGAEMALLCSAWGCFVFVGLLLPDLTGTDDGNIGLGDYIDWLPYAIYGMIIGIARRKSKSGRYAILTSGVVAVAFIVHSLYRGFVPMWVD